MIIRELTRGVYVYTQHTAAAHVHMNAIHSIFVFLFTRPLAFHFIFSLSYAFFSCSQLHAHTALAFHDCLITTGRKTVCFQNIFSYEHIDYIQAGDKNGSSISIWFGWENKQNLQAYFSHHTIWWSFFLLFCEWTHSVVNFYYCCMLFYLRAREN